MAVQSHYQTTDQWVGLMIMSVLVNQLMRATSLLFSSLY